MSIQAIALIIVSLLGIPAGMFLKSVTEEEMKPGRKWFVLISGLSAMAFLLSILASGDERSLLMTTFSFIFFLCVMPLVKFKK